MQILRLYTFLCLLGILYSARGDDAFLYLFRTEKSIYRDYPISFDNPIPTWLRGSMIRNSAAQFGMGDKNFTNAADGYAKLLSFKFPGNGSAFFSTQFLHSKSYMESNASNTIAPFPTYGTVDPPYNAMQRLQAVTTPLDEMNVNVNNFSNSFGAITDAWNYYQFNPLTLDTIGFKEPDVPDFDGNPNPPGVQSFMSSAHPLLESTDPTSQLTFLVGQSIIPGIKSRINLIRSKSNGNREAIAEFEIDKAFYMHSFSVTEQFVIFIGAPFYVNVYDMILTGKMADGLQWNDKDDSKIYVVNIKTGKTTELTTENMFVLHHINAFELPGNKIVMDVPIQPNANFFTSFSYSNLRNYTLRKSMKENARLVRYTIDVDNVRVSKTPFPPSTQVPCAVNLETPTINENYRSANYCFIYGMVFNWDNQDLSHMALVKKDVCGQNRDKIIYIPNHYPSEAWFVAPPSNLAKDEDDGILLSVILDGNRKLSYMAIIDAKTFTISSKAYLPTYVTVTAHGRFFPGLV